MQRSRPEPVWRTPPSWGRVAWYPLWSLYRREVTRYLRIALETVGGALIYSLMFLAVFTLAWPSEIELQPGVTAIGFLVPGIAAFALFHGAFENAAFGLLYDKLEGMLGDLLMSPLSPLETVLAYVAAAATGGLITGGLSLGVLLLLVPVPMTALLPIVAYAVLGSLFFALIGFLTGMWADKWDRYAVIDTFMIMPLGLLSGTFFTPALLPKAGQILMHANPVFYLIDGFRSGFTGRAEAPPLFGFLLCLALVVLLALLTWRLFARGWRIQS